MGVSKSFTRILFLAFCLLGLSAGSASAANFKLDVNNAIIDLGNIQGVKAIDSTVTPPDPPATLSGILTGNQVKVPRANFNFPTKTTDVGGGVEAEIDLDANRDITGTFKAATGEMNLSFDLKATVVALGQTCTIDPIRVATSTQYGKPYLGVPFAVGTAGEGAIVGSWEDLPVPVGGSVCQIVSSLINGPGGIWMSHDLAAAQTCVDNPSHPGCDDSNPCANGPTSECCARRPAFAACPGNEGKPKLSFSVKPRSKRSRAGRTVTFRAKVKNKGTVKAKRARICVAVPRKKARAPKCQTGQVPAGRTMTRTFKVKLRRSAKGKVKVRFRLTTPGASSRTVVGKVKVRRRAH